MDITTRKRLQEWMHRMIFQEASERGNCVKFAVKHINAAGAIKNEIGNLPVSAIVSPEEIPQWASTIDKMTIDDACGIGGMNRYAVLAFFRPTDDEGKPGEVSQGPRHILRVDGGAVDGDGNDESGDMQSTEAPTQRGLTSQLMRHNEVQFKVGTAATAQIISVLQRENARLAEQCAAYMDKQLELVTLVETMHTQRHERELASSTALLKQDAIREGLNKAMMLMPMIVQAIAKKRDVLPIKSTPIEQLMHSFAQSVNGNQMNNLLGQLTPDQQAMLLSIFKEMFQFDVKAMLPNGEKQRDGTERANQNNGTSIVKS